MITLKIFGSSDNFSLKSMAMIPRLLMVTKCLFTAMKISSKKKLSFKVEDTFIKENYMLSGERVTVFTQTSENKYIKLNLEFVFKGKGIQTKVASLSSVDYHWSVSGFYRLDQMLKTISNLPNCYNPLTPKDFAIYVLDDYAVHIIPEIRKALYQRVYVLVVMRGGIIGFIQANDTDLHHHIKSCYRNEEMALVLKKLEVEKNKVLNSEVPANLQAIIKKLILPKGIRRANIEGNELLDYMECEAIFDDLEATRQSDNNDLFFSDEERDQENVALEQGNDVSTTNMPVSPKPSIISSIQNICSDPEVNRDAKFLDDHQKVFEDNGTSIMFKPHLSKMKSAFYEARRSVKKIILTENNINKQQKDKENASKPENTNTLVNIAQEGDSNIFELLQNL